MNHEYRAGYQQGTQDAEEQIQSVLAVQAELLAELKEARIQLAGSGLCFDHPTLRRIDAVIEKSQAGPQAKS